MGRQRTPGLEWLDHENTDQRQWARDYLLLKGRTQHFEYREGIQPDTPYTHEEMLQIGRKIEQEEKDDAYKLFQGMKDAWRQERSRQRKKETGHQACLFILKGDIKDNLKIMAKELDADATALLEKLIAKAYKAHQRKQEKQPKSTLFDGRSDPYELLDRPAPDQTNSTEMQATPDDAIEPNAPSTGTVPEQISRSLVTQTEREAPRNDSPMAMDEETTPCHAIAIQDDTPMQPSTDESCLPKQSVELEGTAPTDQELNSDLAKAREDIKSLIRRGSRKRRPDPPL